MFFCEFGESFKKPFLQNTSGRLLTAFSKSTLGNTETLEISWVGFILEKLWIMTKLNRIEIFASTAMCGNFPMGLLYQFS